MSQRLSESAVKGTLHWFTDAERSSFAKGRHGLLSVPMGVRPDGRLIYPIAGASPDDSSNDEGGAGGSGDGGAGGGSEGQGDKGDGGTGDGADGKDSGAAGTVSKEEFDKVMARMQAADRNAAAAAKALKDLQDKDLSEQEKVAKRVPELEQENTALKSENQKLTAKVAFLGLDGFSWHDPDVALGQVDLSEVFAEDGSVNKKELKKVAEALSKDKPFLVKSAADSGDGKDGKGGTGAGGNGSGQGSSGAGVGSGGKGGSGNGVDEAALKQKYPALNI